VFDPVTLDQLRAFVAVVEEGSFSAAARKLQRVQSAISTAMANLESQLGVRIWDRTTKIPRLTEAGRAVLGSARRVLAEVDGLRQVTAGMASGLEAQVSLCIDALFPTDAVIELCVGFAEAFPTVDLRVDTEVLSAVSARVTSGAATIGVVNAPALPTGVVRRPLAPIDMVPVVSPRHPLAAHDGPLPETRFADAIQIVLAERGDAGVADQGVLSLRSWRVADVHTKHLMIRAGLGWGNLPEHVVRADLRSARLVALEIEGWGEEEHRVRLYAIHRPETLIGPAHRWILAQLEALCARVARPSDAPARPVRRSRRASPRASG